ncbi:GntR family transcriptional regulator [Streptomyces boninensis]|uniref:GntR family transcriptional regulator n=1 Tax=Streptomyces boninensis TaxID=2039455 RepID=UPI003B2160DC
MKPTDFTAALADGREQLARTSTAERVAGILRTRIADGLFRPGTRLSEDAIGEALGVSRNTLREAFRLLTHERLLVHEFSRGVFVRELTAADAAELYRLRRLLECGVLRELGPGPYDVRALAAAVAEGERAAAAADWQAVATANIRFHRALVALAGSPRMDELMGAVLAELRLAFQVVAAPRELHEPFVGRNAAILAALRAGEAGRAEALLGAYLTESGELVARLFAAVGS